MDWFFKQFFDFTSHGFKGMILSTAEILISLTINLTEDFWSDPVIVIIFDFSFWVNTIIFGVSVLIFISDIVQEASTRAVDWAYVISNFFKAWVFIYCNRWIGIFAMKTADILVAATNFREEINKSSSLISGILDAAKGFFTSIPGITSPDKIVETLVPIVIIIASIIFLFVALLRFGAMLLQILTSAFYISGIMRGDSSKMSEWLTQTAAISCTFVFQHLMYYLGIFFLLRGSTLLGLGLMLSITLVGKVMQKFSFATGTQNTMANVARMASFAVPRFM